MNEYAKRILDEARATLERIADVKVTQRAHRTDGLLTEWSRHMPRKPPPVTAGEVKAMISDALAAQPHTSTAEETKRLIESALAARDEALLAAVGQVIGETRKQLRTEIAAHRSNEFFYTDENGKQQDAELHKAIINPVDYPIDEKIMKPIRERNRAKWLAEQDAERRATRQGRVIDLPALPLRGRHG
jgi:hypothetical protein